MERLTKFRELSEGSIDLGEINPLGAFLGRAISASGTISSDLMAEAFGCFAGDPEDLQKEDDPPNRNSGCNNDDDDGGDEIAHLMDDTTLCLDAMIWF